MERLGRAGETLLRFKQRTDGWGGGGGRSVSGRDTGGVPLRVSSPYELRTSTLPTTYVLERPEPRRRTLRTCLCKTSYLHSTPHFLRSLRRSLSPSVRPHKDRPLPSRRVDLPCRMRLSRPPLLFLKTNWTRTSLLPVTRIPPTVPTLPPTHGPILRR